MARSSNLETTNLGLREQVEELARAMGEEAGGYQAQVRQGSRRSRI